MKIHSFTTFLAIPVIVLAAGMFYLEFYTEHSVGMYLLIPVILLVSLYIMKGEIDYQWHKRNPKPMADVEKKLLENHIPFYRTLSDEGKQKFEHRVYLYIDAREFKNVGQKELLDIPDDIKVLMAAQVIQLTFNREDFLLEKFHRVYTYKHPFPTPKYQFLHTIEVDTEDGLILFSMEHALPGMTNPTQYYNVVMHGFVEAYLHQHPDVDFPNVEDVTWQHIEQITGFTQKQILDVLGFKKINILPVALNCFFTYPERTKAVLGRSL